eukprot:553155-Hanusia_phi.AAC.2
MVAGLCQSTFVIGGSVDSDSCNTVRCHTSNEADKFRSSILLLCTIALLAPEQGSVNFSSISSKLTAMVEIPTKVNTYWDQDTKMLERDFDIRKTMLNSLGHLAKMRLQRGYSSAALLSHLQRLLKFCLMEINHKCQISAPMLHPGSHPSRTHIPAKDASMANNFEMSLKCNSRSLVATILKVFKEFSELSFQFLMKNTIVGGRLNEKLGEFLDEISVIYGVETQKVLANFGDDRESSKEVDEAITDLFQSVITSVNQLNQLIFDAVKTNQTEDNEFMDQDDYWDVIACDADTSLQMSRGIMKKLHPCSKILSTCLNKMKNFSENDVRRYKLCRLYGELSLLLLRHGHIEWNDCKFYFTQSSSYEIRRSVALTWKFFVQGLKYPLDLWIDITFQDLLQMWFIFMSDRRTYKFTSRSNDFLITDLQQELTYIISNLHVVPFMQDCFRNILSAQKMNGNCMFESEGFVERLSAIKHFLKNFGDHDFKKYKSIFNEWIQVLKKETFMIEGKDRFDFLIFTYEILSSVLPISAEQLHACCTINKSNGNPMRFEGMADIQVSKIRYAKARCIPYFIEGLLKMKNAFQNKKFEKTLTSLVHDALDSAIVEVQMQTFSSFHRSQSFEQWCPDDFMQSLFFNHVVELVLASDDTDDIDLNLHLPSLFEPLKQLGPRLFLSLVAQLFNRCTLGTVRDTMSMTANTRVLRAFHIFLHLMIETVPEGLNIQHVQSIPVLIKECLQYASFLCIGKVMELLGRQLVLESSYLTETFEMTHHKLTKIKQEIKQLPSVSTIAEGLPSQGRDAKLTTSATMSLWSFFLPCRIVSGKVALPVPSHQP